MGFFSKFWSQHNKVLQKYTLRLAVRGPTGDTRHQFVTFEAGSLKAAIQHAERRAKHAHVVRWKLLSGQNQQVAWGFGGKRVTPRATDAS